MTKNNYGLIGRGIATGLFVISTFFMSSANAALLGLTPTYPDVSGSNLSVNYDYTPYSNKQGGTPGFGVLTIEGASTALFVNIDGTLQEGFFGNYTLTANFAEDGSFVAAGSSLSITSLQAFTSSNGSLSFGNGDVVLAFDLAAFGFFGTGTAGVFDMSSANESGALVDQIAPTGWGGVIVSPLTLGLGAPVGGWDQSMFTNNFSGTAATNNFIPLPAAGWFFMSAVVGLMGLSQRKKLG